MDISTKEILKFTYCTVNNNINEIIIELLFCFQYGKSLTESELSSKQKKISLLYEEYMYIKKIIKKNYINLRIVCEKGYEIIVKGLFEHRFQDCRYDLERACSSGFETVVKYLVENGANVYRNKDALTEACRNEHETIVKYLVEHGADVKGNEDALKYACENGYESIVKYLVEHGADEEIIQRVKML